MEKPEIQPLELSLINPPQPILPRPTTQLPSTARRTQGMLAAARVCTGCCDAAIQRRQLRKSSYTCFNTTSTGQISSVKIREFLHFQHHQRVATNRGKLG